MPGILTSALIVGGSAMIWLLMRLRTYRTAEGSEEEFSIAQYEPMNRLLAEDDFLFLAAQPGYRPEIGKKLRKERRLIFRMYLSELAGDFRRLHRQARALVAESHEQHAELVGLLIRQQLMFWRLMAAMELRLTMHQVGVGHVDAGWFVDSFEAMRVDLARLSVPMQAAV